MTENIASCWIRINACMKWLEYALDATGRQCRRHNMRPLSVSGGGRASF
jgi:hypothetical protein